MKKEIKGFVIGVITTVLLITLTTSAYALTQKNLSVAYDDIKVVLNGQQLYLTDSESKQVEPFIYEGTTYLPLRAIASSLGLNSSWDNTAKTVYLTGYSKLSEGSVTSEGNGVVLTEGIYTAGKDFPAGAYNITCIEGTGVVESSNLFDGGVTALFGSEKEVKANGYDPTMFRTYYENAYFTDGVKVEVMGNGKFKLELVK